MKIEELLQKKSRLEARTSKTPAILREIEAPNQQVTTNGVTKTCSHIKCPFFLSGNICSWDLPKWPCAYNKDLRAEYKQYCNSPTLFTNKKMSFNCWVAGTFIAMKNASSASTPTSHNGPLSISH